MSMIDRFRSRQESTRRVRAIERALRSANSAAVRNEILAIARRHYS